MTQRLKPKRPLAAVLSNFYQILAANSSLSQVTWQIGRASHIEASSPAIRLATWNIFKANSGTDFFQEYHRLVQSTDVLLLQEVLSTRDELGRYLPEGWQGIHSGSYERRDGKREGVLTASRFAQTKALRLLAPRQEPLVKTPKVGLATVIQVASQQVHLINLHLPLLRTAKQSQFDLEKMLGEVASLEGAVIVAGDFNSFHSGYLRLMQEVLASYGLRQVVINSDPRPKLARLDHLFIKGLKVRHVRIASEYKTSDHFPIICELIVS